MDTSVTVRQRRVFGLLAEFFRRATGEDVEQFARRGEFGHVIRTEGARIAARGADAFAWLEAAHRTFYGTERMASFRDAADLGGIKLVLGGSSRFGSSHLGSVRKMLLYADTILVPDPILPWLEQEREEEKFRHVLLLETAFWLLHLKPLVDADLPYPAIVVFPSWERSLELRDETTALGQRALVVATVGPHINQDLASFDDLVHFAKAREGDFLQSVERASLFLAPGAEKPEPLDRGIARYRDALRTWRADDRVEQLEALPLGHLVLNGLMERINPHYHLLENAQELHAQPMMCIDAHWHYHKLICAALETKLSHAGMLTDKAVATIRAINQPGLRWLGNVPLASLVELRRDNANERFRRELAGSTEKLFAAQLDDLDRVAAEVGHDIAAMIGAHQQDIRKIEDDYKLSHKQTLATSVTTAAALFAPALAPFVGSLATPVGLAAKYLYDKAHERQARSQAARSLTGVLAKAHATPDT